MSVLNIIFSVLSLLLTMTATCVEAKVPIQYGGAENLDACSSIAMVDHLGKNPKEFLAVKDAPNLKALRTDKLLQNKKIWICEESKDGKWFGIVYPAKDDQDCGVTKVVEIKKAYDGPCKSGWVNKKYITIVAG
ncbi:MAG: hypothetical protein AB7O96_10520 [Pseudobdellovibrionaceae bacterium]